MPNLFGTAPNQAPTNGDLGTLAFQDANAVKITGGEVTAVQKTDTAISETNPSLNLDFANTKSLDPRITFTRNTTATFYDGKTVAKAEENLLTYSQDFDNASWSKTNSTVVANTAVSPDGALTADAIIRSGTSLSNVSLAATRTVATYTVSVYAKAGTQNYLAVQVLTNGTTKGSFITFNLTNGAIGTEQNLTSLVGLTASAVNVGNGWYRCVVTYTSLGGSDNILFNPANAADTRNGDDAGTVYLWGAQLEQRSAVSSYTPTTSSPVTNYIPALQTCPVNSARFDHDPVTGESKGLLIEEQRTNLLTYSEQFNDGSWSKTNATVTANAIVAPDGTLTGDKLFEDAANSTHSTYKFYVPASGAVTFSCYVKAAGRTRVHLTSYEGSVPSNPVAAVFDLSSGTVVSSSGLTTASSIAPVGNGWYRCSVSGASAGTSTSWSIMLVNTGINLTYTGDGTSGIYIWGAQLEVGSTATSYIPTTTAQVTRSADAASITGTNFSSWYRADEGTLYAEYSRYATSIPANSLYAFGISDNSFNNVIGLRNNFGGTNDTLGVVANGASQAVISVGTATTAFVKKAGAYRVNSFQLAKDSVLGTEDTSGIVPVADRAGIGCYINSGIPSEFLNGAIKRLAYFPKRLSNDELVEMTS